MQCTKGDLFEWLTELRVGSSIAAIYTLEEAAKPGSSPSLGLIAQQFQADDEGLKDF